MTDQFRDPFRAAEALGLAMAVRKGRVSPTVADGRTLPWRQAGNVFLSHQPDVEATVHSSSGAGIGSVRDIFDEEPAFVHPVVLIKPVETRGRPVRVDAFPGPEAAGPGSRQIEHGPPHIHIEDREGNKARVSTETLEPIRGSRPLSPVMQKWLNSLKDNAKLYYQMQQDSIFKTGQPSGAANLQGVRAISEGATKEDAGTIKARNARAAKTHPAVREAMRRAPKAAAEAGAIELAARS